MLLAIIMIWCILVNIYVVIIWYGGLVIIRVDIGKYSVGSILGILNIIRTIGPATALWRVGGV